MGNESCAVSGWSVRFHVPGINAQARRKVEGTSFTKSGTHSTHPPPNGSNQSTRSVHIKQTPNPATLFPSPPPPILFFSVVVAASHAAFFQALPLSFSPSVVGPASHAVILAFSPLCHPRLLPPLSSSTLVPDILNRGSSQVKDPGFFACIPAPSHGALLPLPMVGEGWGEGEEMKPH